MNKTIALISFLLSSFFIHTSVAQEDIEQIFTVRIGNFNNATHSDFQNLHPLSFVFAEQNMNGLQLVSIGTFDDQALATQLLNKVKKQNFPDAYLQSIPTNKKVTIPVIQILTVGIGNTPDWRRLANVYDRLYAMQDNDLLKLFIGGYENELAAKSDLEHIKILGYDGAFFKSVSPVVIHKITAFESGVEIDWLPQEGDLVAKGNQGIANEAHTAQKNEIAQPIVFAPKKTILYPEIKSEIKRTAALRLQTILKKNGQYTGSLNGYYDEATKQAYALYAKENQIWNNYALILKHEGLKDAHRSPDLESSLFQLFTQESGGIEYLITAKDALSKAYLAYTYFSQKGANEKTNILLNEAISSTFKDNDSSVSFDPEATYNYVGFKQLIEHLAAIHEATAEAPAVPCWLFERHPDIANKAFKNSQLPFQNCSNIRQYEEVQMLRLIAADLGITTPDVPNHTNFDKIFLAPQLVDKDALNKAMEWDKKLWNGLNAWAELDPLHLSRVNALKVAFYQSQLRIEAYFIEMGLKPEEAKPLATYTLQHLVGDSLGRFI